MRVSGPDGGGESWAFTCRPNCARVLCWAPLKSTGHLRTTNLLDLLSTTSIRPVSSFHREQTMAIAAVRWRLWRGVGTAAAAAAAASGTDGNLLARLVSEPECRVKATMEEAASSGTHRDGAFWEPPVTALLRASSPTKAHLVSRFSPHSLAPSIKLVVGLVN